MYAKRKARIEKMRGERCSTKRVFVKRFIDIRISLRYQGAPRKVVRRKSGGGGERIGTGQSYMEKRM